MQLLWRYRIPLLLLVAYWVLALGLYVRWERENWYPTTGDEPHYLDVGRSILHHGSLEMTAYYEAVAERQGRPGDIPRPGEYHTFKGGDGLFSDHSIGTGVMAVPALLLTEAIGYHRDVPVVRASFVLLSGAAVLASWVLARIYVSDATAQVLAVVLVCFGLPVVFSANQIFPDLPAGIAALCVLSYIGWRARGTPVPSWADAAALTIVATIPFLHYKLSPLALILGVAVLFAASQQGAPRQHLLLSCCIPLVAGVAFFSYNLYAFNDPLGTPAEVHSNVESIVRWLFTFSVDRWHGFLLQNPALFIGALFYVPFLLRHPIVAVPAMLCFLAAMGINAAHGNGGGFSFAGRHAWTGALMVIPAAIFGIGCIEGMSRRILFALGGGLLFIQALAIIPLAISKRALYNQPSETWFDVYPSFYPETINRFLPAIYNDEWWQDYAVNWVYILFAAALIAIGAFVYPRRRDLTLPAAGSLLAITLPVVVLVSLVQTDPPREPRHWDGSAMHRRFGNVLPRTVEAKVEQHSAGIWTFGPYTEIAPGDYRVTFIYSADASSGTRVGSWDVTGRGGRVRFAAGDLYGSNGLRAVATGTFTVASWADGKSFEMRTFFADVSNVLLGEIVLEPATEP